VMYVREVVIACLHHIALTIARWLVCSMYCENNV
jgi:hypothetical protein